MRTTQRFVNLLSQDRKDLIYLYVYSALQGIINLSLPIGIQAIMSLLLAGRLSASWTVLTLIVTIGIVLAGTLQIFQLYIVELLQRKLFVRAAFEFAYRIPLFRIKQLGTAYAPEVVHKFFDVVGVQKNLNKVLLDFSSSSLQILFGLILLSLYHPVFIAFGLALLLLLFLIIYLSSRKGLATSIEESNSKYRMAFWLTELARAISTFKLQGGKEMSLHKTDVLANEYLSNRKRHFRVVVAQWISILTLKTLVTAGLLIIGALLLINNSITIGQFVASEIVIILVMNSSEKLIDSMESIYDLLTSVEKLGKVTDLELDELREDSIPLEGSNGHALEVQALNVYGLIDGKPILEDLNFSIGSGERVCLSGPSGCGKSSLLKVLASLLDTYQGQIKVNGSPLNHLNLAEYRESVRVIFSDQEVFAGSIMDNIGMHHPDLSPAQIMDAARRVGLEPFIDRLPNGYYEQINNAEFLLSKTERVRLITARALVNKPRLILAEDVFSNLDERESLQLLDVLMEHSPETTLIMASNNPEVINRCSNQIVLKKSC